ncbi:MAG: transglycosylase SLT domain-containing protein [Dehalococcoidia bacterium]
MARRIGRPYWGRALLSSILALVAVFATSSSSHAQEPGTLTGDIHSSGGVSLVVWSGGSVEQVGQAAMREGCDAVSTWMTASGDLIGYVFGAPSFANAAFLDHSGEGELASGTPLVLVCRGQAGSPAPATLAAPDLTNYLPPSADVAQYRLAIERRDAGDYEAAATEFGQLAAEGGVFAPIAMMRAGQMLYAADHDADAVSAFGFALDMPGLPGTMEATARLDAAQALDHLGRHAEVVSMTAGITPAIGATASQMAEALWLGAQAKRELGDPNWPADALTVASTYPATGAARAALDALEEIGAAVPMLEAAYVRYRHGQDAAARTAYEQVAASGSTADAAIAWFYLGALAEREGDDDAAVAAYRRSIDLDPTGGLADDSHWWAAYVLNSSGQEMEAAVHWATLSAGFPSSSFAADAGVRAALAYVGEDQVDAAASVLRTMLEQSVGASAARAARWLRVLGYQAPPPAQFDPRSVSAILDATQDSAATEPLPVTARTEWGAGGSANWSAAATWMQARYGVPPTGDIQGADIVRVAFGLAAAGDEPVARTILYAHIQQLTDRPYDRLTLSRLASDAGLHDVSIGAANHLVAGLTSAQRLETPRAIEQLIYPTPFAEETLAAARAEGIPPLLLTALVRRESLFQPTAGSPVGASGLAQIMPDTGREIAAALGVPWDPAMLLDPATSLRFGAYYLSRQLVGFDGDVWGALAAYNGGPGNASRWYQMQSYPGADWYIEAIDFAETRLYLRVVMEEYAWYRYLYAGASAPTMR